jgi:hypothetical protein
MLGYVTQIRSPNPWIFVIIKPCDASSNAVPRLTS